MGLIYKVTANGTEYRFTDESTAMSWASIAKTHMVVDKTYSWSGVVTVEILEVDEDDE